MKNLSSNRVLAAPLVFCRRIGFALARLIACFAVSAAAHAQLLDPATPPPNELEQFINVLVAWDFSGMTADEENAFIAVMDPATEQEILQLLTPAQRQERDDYVRMFNDPDGYAKWMAAHPLTLEQATAREESIWMITHPLEYGELQNQHRTQAELDELWASAVAFSQPARPFVQTAAQQEAEKQIANPAIKPKPVTIAVPINEAASLLSGPNSPALLNQPQP